MEKSEKPEKRKYRKGIAFLIIVVVIFLVWAYLKSPYTPIEERKIINYALQGSRSDFKILSINNNDDAKFIRYTLINKRSCVAESFFKIRLKMNEYLENNLNYFLNDGYSIIIYWAATPSGGPTNLSFANTYGEYYGKSCPPKIIKQFDSLDCLFVGEDLQGFSLSNISDPILYEDIKGLLLEEQTYIGDVENLKNIKSLEFFEPNDKITDEEIERVKEMHPNCEIYGR